MAQDIDRTRGADVVNVLALGVQLGALGSLERNLAPKVEGSRDGKHMRVEFC